jgi:hypothetical protein
MCLLKKLLAIGLIDASSAAVAAAPHPSARRRANPQVRARGTGEDDGAQALDSRCQ